jgi:crotonobetainyl-CoA:carnitine CoA-transferase CaiB-like acyl-CoA transferase
MALTDPSPVASGPLAGLKVIELGDGTAGPYCAKLLADYGAEVVKIEAPDGDSTRRRGPFPDAHADAEASGLFLYLNINKYGIKLDMRDATDRATLDGLLAHADVFVTNMTTERLREADVTPQALRSRHPQLVITTISPFGSVGPWADRRGDELVSYAMGGLAYGSPGVPDAAADLEDEPPLHPACFAAETIAGVIAAGATLTAVFARARTGTGCHVEVSEQAAVAAMQQRDVTAYSYANLRHTRLLDPAVIGRMPNFYLPCRDGYVAVAAPLDLHWQRLIEAMGTPPWAGAPEFATGAARTANWSELRLRIMEWTMTVTGDELYTIAVKQGLPMFPFYSIRKMAESAHVRSRETLVDVEIGGRDARMPAAPFKMQKTPWSLRRPAPRLGEHTDMILREWLGRA